MEEMRMKNKLKTLSTLAVCVFFIQGCSTTQSSIATGAGVGGLAGGGVGAIADPGPNGNNRFRNVVIGTAAGALVGAGVGYAINRSNHDATEDGKQQGKKEAEDEQNKRNQSSAAGGAPELIPPKTEAKWIPDQVKSSTFIPGHFEYSIITPARWETK
jgi:hypothetical protein